MCTVFKAIYKTLDWIPEEKLVPRAIYMNNNEGASSWILNRTKRRPQLYWIYDSPHILSIINNRSMLKDYNFWTNPKITLKLFEEIYEEQIKCIETDKKQIYQAIYLKDMLELFWSSVCKNVNAIHFIEKHMENIRWNALSENPNAIHILEKNKDKINWRTLSGNPNAVHILEENEDKINWDNLSGNPNAIHILERNIEKINWEKLSGNPNAGVLLEKKTDSLNWTLVCENPSATVELIENNQEKILLYELANNTNIEILKYLEKKLTLYTPMYEEESKLWLNISMNPSIFKLDTKAMKDQCQMFSNELISVVLKPQRVERIANNNGLDLYEYFEQLGF